MSLDDPSRRAVVAAAAGALGGGYVYARHAERSTSREDDENESVVGPLRRETPAATQRTEAAATEEPTEEQATDESEEPTATEAPDHASFRSMDGRAETGVDRSDKPVLGSAEATVEMTYWTDYQCPFCKEFEEDTLPGLSETYVSPGRLRFVFVALPYTGEDSMTAAVAGRCVWEQVVDSSPDLYWRWRKEIISRQGEENSGWASKENLIEYTRDVRGVSADALESCFDEHRAAYESDVEDDTDHARSNDVDGTPVFSVVNAESGASERIVGAQPRDRFDEVIQDVEES